jgi:hypothetical protein
MPLVMGDASTDRPQQITFDPACPAQGREARARYKRLRKSGYRLRGREPGALLLDPPPRDPNLGVFRILSQSGDDRIVWDRRVAAQVKDAYRKFKELIGKGYTAYATLGGGKRGHKLDDFDPGLEEILMVPSTVPG